MEKLTKDCYYMHIERELKYPGLYHYDGENMVCCNILKADNTPFLVLAKDVIIDEWELYENDKK